jgi:hypothetical protein
VHGNVEIAQGHLQRIKQMMLKNKRKQQNPVKTWMGLATLCKKRNTSSLAMLLQVLNFRNQFIISSVYI